MTTPESSSIARRLLRGLDVYERQSEEQIYRYRMLQDLETHEYAVVQIDGWHEDFNQSGWHDQEKYFQENMVANWSHHLFYPTVQEAINAFHRE